MALGIGLSTGVFELVARCSNAVSIAAAGVVAGATGAQLESVGELIGLGAKGNSVAVDRHRRRHAVEVDKGAISVGIAGESAASGN